MPCCCTAPPTSASPCALKNNGYKIVHSPLVKDENGVWRMDFEDMDAKIKANHIHVAVFCSPHNPCGRVWERWEIEKAMEVYKANDCIVISDEIWSDIILEGHKHIPTQSVSEDARMRTVAVYAPSKTFNLAGLVGSYHIIYNPTIRDRVVAKSSKPHYNDMNVLSMHALIGAYKPEGYEWVDELRQTITGNVDYACDYITKHFEGVTVSKPEGTYMLFVDCTEWCEKHGKTIQELEKACWNVGVAIQDGRMFHGPCSIRMRQHRTIPALRLKHRSGGCGTASALPKCSIMSGCGTRIVLRGQKPLALCDRCPCFGSLFPPLAALTFAASSIICAFGLASAAPRSPYRHLELCGIA